MTNTGQMIDRETAVKMASRFLLDKIGSYQMMPLNEDGTIDWESYEPGCTNWNLLGEMSISSAEIASEQDDEDDYWVVVVFGIWSWSEDDYMPTDFHFEVIIPKDADPAKDNDFDYERYS